MIRRALRNRKTFTAPLSRKGREISLRAMGCRR